MHTQAERASYRGRGEPCSLVEEPSAQGFISQGSSLVTMGMGLVASLPLQMMLHVLPRVI